MAKFGPPPRLITFRFLASLIRPEDGPLTTPCWIIWDRARTPNGYVNLRCNGKPRGAHRLMYELLFGPIPDGLLVRHHCDRKVCINPCHLDVGMPAHNVADKMARGREARGERNGWAKLTETQICEIRDLLKQSALSHRRIGDLFGVSKTAICDIGRGATWKHVVD
jgi:hypothetical protein